IARSSAAATPGSRTTSAAAESCSTCSTWRSRTRSSTASSHCRSRTAPGAGRLAPSRLSTSSWSTRSSSAGPTRSPRTAIRRSARGARRCGARQRRGCSRTASPNWRGRTARSLKRDVWWTLREGLEPGHLAPEDARRIAGFVERFDAEREAAPRLSLETLIDRAVTSSGYDRVVLRMPDGERRMANVRKLMRLAREYEADEGRDLRGFIDFVAEQDMLRAREGEAPLETEGINAVRLMTIHA